jgi:hypothetical protein
MQQQVRFVVRPNTKDGYVALLRESTLIQNRSTLATSAPSPDHWRHGWIYDSGSDMEPNISDSSNRSVWAWPPQPDEPVLKQFMEVAMAEQDEVHDIFIMPSCRSKGSKSAFQKILGSKLIVQDDLHITYKECSKRGARNSVEIVFAASSKKFPVTREGPRKIFFGDDVGQQLHGAGGRLLVRARLPASCKCDGIP